MPDQTGEEPADFDQKLRKSYYDDPKIASENLANARLIAAAPELLSALEDMLGTYMGDREMTAEDCVRAADIARAAIAKAKGEA